MRRCLLFPVLVFLLIPVPLLAEPAPGSPAPWARPARAPAATAHSPEAYALHVQALRQRITGLEGRFSIVEEPPFVLIGDSGRADLRRHAELLVRRTVQALHTQYGMHDPPHILDIWLLAGERSYLTNARRLTGDEPDTPYGFYSSSLRALIMNSRTGGGTLVHELIHPFVEANFPGCPPWFNEGLGSLYEAVGWPGGQIKGYVNWRLPALQQDLRRGRVPSFRWLMSRNETQFYGSDPGSNYGQSRYLVFYLQEQGLLTAYYERFRASVARDPSGYQTLLELLGLTEEEMPAFRRKWETFVLRLRWQRS